VKPFVLLATRPEDAAADGEYEAMLRFGGLGAEQLVRVRLESGPLPALDLDEVSGIIVGGSPFTTSEPEHTKSDVQRRVEAELAALVTEVLARDFPFLGACYGVGTLGVHQGAVIDSTFAEAVGAVPITLTAQGARDPLLAGIPMQFDAFVGHKEACHSLPEHVVLLASSPTCPVQMFRVKQNLYATQFHPELDVTGIVQRIKVYRHAGYFPPDDADAVIATVRNTRVTVPPRILANFARRYGA
jgi:GMP synthase (glutamine-hydrolysing)